MIAGCEEAEIIGRGIDDDFTPNCDCGEILGGDRG